MRVLFIAATLVVVGLLVFIGRPMNFFIGGRWILQLVVGVLTTTTAEPEQSTAVTTTIRHSTDTMITTTTTTEKVVKVRFYGESQCPFCRKFVTTSWKLIWDDDELRALIDYDYIPWGNAYFATDVCGRGPYNADERQCWWKECIGGNGGGGGRNSSSWNNHDDDDDNDCFKGPVVYQHSEKEGLVDIYESCVKELYGIDEAVDFTYCAEGPKMDQADIPEAKDLMQSCAKFPDDVQLCFDLRGRLLEIDNARQTPDHPGVPYVVVDGEALDDPFEVKGVICERLQRDGLNIKLPAACDKANNPSLRHPVQDRITTEALN